ncbi:uncharacterized protein LOC142317501 [Lycorma delicatula]|uniref:uncharacterized protein LOC142317501 n=1 Tax=Lycorma delicatula TaxID=130591 RepID=UPI003F51A7C3
MDVDFVITSEPNKYVASGNGWCADRNGDVAICDVGGRIRWRLAERGDSLMALELAPAVLIRVYITPNCDIPRYAEFMNRLHELVTRARRKVIILCDFNFKIIEADYTVINRRGEILADLMHLHGTILDK